MYLFSFVVKKTSKIYFKILYLFNHSFFLMLDFIMLFVLFNVLLVMLDITLLNGLALILKGFILNSSKIRQKIFLIILLALFNISSLTWLYVFIVCSTSCPSNNAAVLKSTPLEISIVAYVCLNSCNVIL